MTKQSVQTKAVKFDKIDSGHYTAAADDGTRYKIEEADQSGLDVRGESEWLVYVKVADNGDMWDWEYLDSRDLLRDCKAWISERHAADGSGV